MQIKREKTYEKSTALRKEYHKTTQVMQSGKNPYKIDRIVGCIIVYNIYRFVIS